MQVLFDDTLMRIQHKYYYMSVLNGLQGFDDGKLFNGFSGLAALADACRVDKRIVLAATFKRDVDTVACGAGLVINHYSFFTEHAVHKSRFAYIGSAGNRNTNAVRGFIRN